MGCGTSASNWPPLREKRRAWRLFSCARKSPIVRARRELRAHLLDLVNCQRPRVRKVIADVACRYLLVIGLPAEARHGFLGGPGNSATQRAPTLDHAFEPIAPDTGLARKAARNQVLFADLHVFGCEGKDVRLVQG